MEPNFTNGDEAAPHASRRTAELEGIAESLAIHWEPAFFAQWTLLFLLPILLHPASVGKVMGSVNPYWATAIVVPLLFGAGYLIGRSLSGRIPHVEEVDARDLPVAAVAVRTPAKAARARARAPRRAASRSRSGRRAA